jgi:hypothetical protein
MQKVLFAGKFKMKSYPDDDIREQEKKLKEECFDGSTFRAFTVVYSNIRIDFV